MDNSIVSIDKQRLYINNNFFNILEKNNLLRFNNIFNLEETEIAKKFLDYRYTLKLNLKDINNNPQIFFIKKYFDFKNQKACKEATREWKAMWIFLKNDIPAPIPVALGLDKDKAFILSKGISHTHKLNEWSRIYLNNTIDEQVKQNVINQIAKIVGKMHKLHLFHQDLYLCHFLCNSKKETLPISLIDLQRVKIKPKFELKWKIKDLAQLFFSAKKFITNKDIEYFWTNYSRISNTNIPKRFIFYLIYIKAKQIERHTQKHNL